jgi:hypothetical protein
VYHIPLTRKLFVVTSRFVWIARAFEKMPFSTREPGKHVAGYLLAEGMNRYVRYTTSPPQPPYR